MGNLRYESFNGLRAISAIGILLMHYLANIDSDIKMELMNANFLYSKIIPDLTLFVYLFFIISAFSMCCGYYYKFEVIEGKSSFDTDKFYLRRYHRIWPFFALLVLIDLLMKPTLEEFYQCFADLTLAFNFLPNPHIDAIGVGWFLGIIFLFYMIFPWFVFLLQNKSRAWLTMLVAIVFHIILVRYFLTSEFCTDYQIASPRHNIVYSFPFFMAGGLLYLYRDRLKCNKNVVYLYAILAISFTSLQIVLTPQIFGENILFVLALFVCWVLYAMTGGIGFNGYKFLDNKLMKFLSDISMEIYLCHMVMFRVIEKMHIEDFIPNHHLFYWVICILGIGLSVIFSWIIKYKLFDIVSRNIHCLAWMSPK